MLQFPTHKTYYLYHPPGPNANLLQRTSALISLVYYKYLLHTGMYVLTKNERRIINTIVLASILLSINQLYQLFIRYA